MGNFGKLALKYFFKPKARFKNYVAKGGSKGFKRIKQAEAKAKSSADSIKIHFTPNKNLNIAVLSGKKHWYQTIFMLKSLFINYTTRATITVLDDGSMDEQFINKINIQLPGVNVITAKEQDEIFTSQLPVANFPYIHQAAKFHPMFRKLFQLRIALKGYQLYLDSDLIFYDFPDFIAESVENKRPIYMTDKEGVYFYDKAFLQSLLDNGNILRDRVNAGIVGLNSDCINWKAVEDWTKELINSQGPHFFLEQAVTALIMSQLPSEGTPSEYIIDPSKTMVINSKGKLHHYVGSERDWYHLYALSNFYE